MFKSIDINKRILSDFLPWGSVARTRADSEKYIEGSLSNCDTGGSFGFRIDSRVQDTVVYSKIRSDLTPC